MQPRPPSEILSAVLGGERLGSEDAVCLLSSGSLLEDRRGRQRSPQPQEPAGSGFLHRRPEHQLHERLLLRLLLLRLLPEEGRSRRLRPVGGGAFRENRGHDRGGRGPRAAAGGRLHPDWGIGEAVRLVRAVKRHPILLHGFSRRKCGTSRISRR